MGKFSITDLIISLAWFGLWCAITVTFIFNLSNPFELFENIVNSHRALTIPLWGKLLVWIFLLYLILPTTRFMKSYYAALGDVILFIFRKKKFKEVTYHFDARRW